MAAKPTLQQKAQLLEKNLKIKDRRWKLKTYNNAFIGNEAVPIIIKLKFAKNAYKAVLFGNKLLDKGLIKHVENEHAFKNENKYYQFTDKYFKTKGTLQVISTPKKKKKISFQADPVDGFKYDDVSDADDDIANNDIADNFGSYKNVWNSFGSLSKSEFSFMSDRSSFAASLNTLSDTNQWIVDDADEKDQKLDLSKQITGFTFGSNDNDDNKDNDIDKPDDLNRIRTISVTAPKSPSFSNHSKSISFSNTLSLYTDSEKKQNSLLFFDLWGIPATKTRNQSVSNSNSASVGSVGSLTLTKHRSGSSFGSTVVSVPINEEEEDDDDWSDFDPDGDELISMSEPQPNSHHANNSATVSFSSPTLTSVKAPKSKKFKYSKRKSVATNSFIFGGQTVTINNANWI